MKKKGRVFFLLIILCSCNSHTAIPNNIINSQKMQLILWDVLRADKLSDALVKQDSTANSLKTNTRLYDSVFAIHHISRSEFENSLSFYTHNPDLFKIILDSMNAQEMRKITFNNNKNKSQLPARVAP